jgi:hypothetical protein
LTELRVSVLTRIGRCTEIVGIYFHVWPLWDSSIYVPCHLEKISGSPEKNDNSEEHYNHEENVFQILCVIRTIGHILFDLAEVSLESLSALAHTIEAHASVHALPGAVWDFSAKNFHISAVVQLARL